MLLMQAFKTRLFRNVQVDTLQRDPAPGVTLREASTMRARSYRVAAWFSQLFERKLPRFAVIVEMSGGRNLLNLNMKPTGVQEMKR